MVARASVNLAALARDVEAIPRTGMIAAARAAKKIATDEGRRYGGGDLRGTKKRGLKLRARDTIRGTGRTATCRVQGTVPAWVWVTSGTGPHRIRRRKRGPKRKLTVPHPGMAPLGPGWHAVVARIEDAVPLIFADELARVVR